MGVRAGENLAPSTEFFPLLLTALPQVSDRMGDCSEMIERMIDEELSQLNSSNSIESMSSGDEDIFDSVDDSADDDEKLAFQVLPESFLACMELERKRLSAIEDVILEDLDKCDVVKPSGLGHYKDILQEIASDLHEDPIQLKERVMSEIVEEELQTALCKACPVGESEDILDDTYRQTEKKFCFELENLEKRLKEEEEKKYKEHRKLKEQLQNEEREEGERRRSRHREFQEELKRIEQNNMIQERNIEDILLPELCQQEDRITELQRCIEEEREAFEIAQGQEQRRIDQLCCNAATVVQAYIRGFLVRKWTRVVFNQKKEEKMKKEQQLHLKRESKEWEENLRREVEEQKMREEEEKRIRQEKEVKVRNKLEEQKMREVEEKRIRQEKEKMRIEMEEQKIREEEEKRIRQEKEKNMRKNMEELKIREEEEKRIRQEQEVKVRSELEEQKMREVEEKRIRQEKEKKMQIEMEMEEQKLRKDKRIRQEQEEKVRRELEEQKIREEEAKRIRKEIEKKIRKNTQEQKIREQKEMRIRLLNEEKLRQQMEEQKIREAEGKTMKLEEEKLRREMEEQKIRDEEEKRIKQEKEKMRKMDKHKISEEEKQRIRQEKEEKLRKDLAEQRIKEEEENRLKLLNQEKVKQQMEEQKIRAEEDKRMRKEKEEKIRKLDEHRVTEEKEKRIRKEEEEKLRREMEEKKIREEEEKRVRQEQKEQHCEREDDLRRNLLEQKINEEGRTIQEKEYRDSKENHNVSLKEPNTIEGENWRIQQKQVQQNIKSGSKKDEERIQKQDVLEDDLTTSGFQSVTEGGRKQSGSEQDTLENRTQQTLWRSSDVTWEVNNAASGDKLMPHNCREKGGAHYYGKIEHSHNSFLSTRNKVAGQSCDSPVLSSHVQEAPCVFKQDCSVLKASISCNIGAMSQRSAADGMAVTGGTNAESLYEDRAMTGVSEKPGASGEPTGIGSAPTSPCSKLPQFCLLNSTEQKRLGWMKTCTPWSQLATRNKRKAPANRNVARRGPVSCLTPLSVDTVLHSTVCTSLAQVTTVTLEDLPGCSLSTLSECTKLQTLTLRRCGLLALEGISNCKDLKYIDVQENSIRFVNCENLENLRVLLLGWNQLTSIHGLESAVNLDVLQLSHNRISRISGLNSLKQLQRLVIDHNQLTSTKGLREVYTLLYLDCAYNHLTSLDDIDNCALLNTLKLQGNNLTEVPCLTNHVLMKALCLDNNCITSLDIVSVSWLPVLQHISVSQNSLTQLPSLSDCVSLLSLDISHNCLLELLNVQQSLNGCLHLQEINLTGNPFQKETSWRSALLETMPGLRKINGESISPSTALGTDGGDPRPSNFLAFCQAQLMQVEKMNKRHMTELCACSPADVPFITIRHSDEFLHLAIEHRYAHEYGDFSFTDKEEVNIHYEEDNPCRCPAKENPQGPEISSLGRNKLNFMQVQETSKNKNHDKTSQEDLQCSPITMAGNRESESPDTDNSLCMNPCQNQTDKRSRTPKPARKDTRRDQMLNLKQMAAVIIQSYWRGYRCRKKTSFKGQITREDSVSTELMCANKARMGSERAAIVIQAVWKGYALRKRLSLALASAQISEPEEDFDEVDVDEFIFDEDVLGEDWITVDSKLPTTPALPFSHELLWTESVVNESTRDKRGASALLRMPRQAWPSSETDKSASLSTSPSTRSYGGSSRTPSISVCCTLSKKAEKILQEWGFTDKYTAHLMLKRAQKMRSEKKNRRLLDPAVRLALFKSNKNKLTPIKAQKKANPEKTDYFKGREASHHAREDPMWASREWTYEWLHKQVACASAGSDHFLPEIDPDILNGKRVQLVAGSGYKDGLNEEKGSRASATDLCPHRREHSQAQRHSAGPTRKEAPAPVTLASGVSKKERISFWDNPVRLSGGWGAGKKRSKPCK
ncbi:leucine-rich repeat and IQ domain-containing protein 1 isoform X1 [Arapaima gigas]